MTDNILTHAKFEAANRQTPESAIRYLEKVEADLDAHGLRYLAYLYMLTGKPLSAVLLLKSRIAADPRFKLDANAWILLAEAFERGGLAWPAIGVLEPHLGVKGWLDNNPRAHLVYANALISHGDIGRAKAHLQPRLAPGQILARNAAARDLFNQLDQMACRPNGTWRSSIPTPRPGT